MRKILYITTLVFMAWSCADEPVETIFFNLNTENGVFIACEGNFMYGNASLSFYDTGTKSIQNNLFYSRNNVPLGDVAQSLLLFKNTLFIVVNNSGKIYLADPKTVEFKGVISGLTSPRHIHVVSDEKAYVSDLYAHHITIINPVTFEKTGIIELSEDHTSEQMVQVGKYIFVSSWSYDKYVLVIDSENDEVVTKIEVPLQPRDLKVDVNHKIWALSGSFENGEEIGGQPALTRIDPETLTVEKIYNFESGSNPSGLEMNAAGDTLYFINKGVCKMPVNSKTLPDSAFITSENKLFYSLGIDPGNNEIYVSDAIDYTQDAVVYRYSPAGKLLDSFKTGINPSDFCFQ